MATVLSPVLLVLLMLFGGFYINDKNIPVRVLCVLLFLAVCRVLFRVFVSLFGCVALLALFVC